MAATHMLDRAAARGAAVRCGVLVVAWGARTGLLFVLPAVHLHRARRVSVGSVTGSLLQGAFLP